MIDPTQAQQPTAEKRPPLWRRDPPGCLKYILLIFLILLLVAETMAGEFRGFPDVARTTWVILFIKLLLIAILITLIRVQSRIFCELTAPTGCTEEEPDWTEGVLKVEVRGSAYGGAFGYYTLEFRKVGDPTLIAGVVSYPGGTPTGASPVNNGTLGWIETTAQADDAYEVKLTVYAAWGGGSKICTTIFNLLKAIVYMNRFAGVSAISDTPAPGNPNPFDPDAELRDAGNDVRSIGGSMTIKGSAYVYECPGRKIKKYGIRRTKIAAPGGEEAQPATGDPIPASFTDVIEQLDYSTPDHYSVWTRIGPADRDLMNNWKVTTIGSTNYIKLKAHNWNSSSVASGRYSVLLTVEDTTGVTYHDIQHIWLDNDDIIGEVVEFRWHNPDSGSWESIPQCMDLSLRAHGTIRIMGLAWDPLIDEAWWSPPTPPDSPNDNFGHYAMRYRKQFQGWNPLTGSIASRVPALPAGPPVPVPTTADAGNLFEWDLTTLDAGAPPPPPASQTAPGGQLYRGESCTFTLELFVTDTTVVPGGPHHDKWRYESVKIVNDL